MPNFPQYHDGFATEVTSQVSPGIDKLAPKGFRVVKVDPKLSSGKLVVDRRMIDLDASRTMHRGPFDDHPEFRLPAVAIVNYETAEAASPSMPGSYKEALLNQEPIEYETGIALAVALLAYGRRCIDIKDVATTTALWGAGTSSTLVGLGGSGVAVTDLDDSDVITDASVAIAAFRANNGGIPPTHWHFSISDLEYMQRHDKLQAVVGANDYGRETMDAIVGHLEAVLKIKCVVHDEYNNGSPIWPATWVFSCDPEGQPTRLRLDGAAVPPLTMAIIGLDDPDANDMGAVMKRWDRPDGNVFNYACALDYDVAVVDNLAIYIVTSTQG